ncbi:MAG: polyphosphate kinase 1 [Ruminococcus sp.]
MTDNKVIEKLQENNVETCEKKEKKDYKNCYINRELSWLKFNERVLEEAEDEKNPLCERLTFLSIFQSNLDEFFMVRMGSLHDMMLLKKEIRENKTRMTPLEQFSLCLSEIRSLLTKRDGIYKKLMNKVHDYGISVVSYSQLSSSEKKYMKRYFFKELAPLLSTIVVGRKQPFPFLNNKELYIVAELRKKNDKAKIGIIPCNTSIMERLVELPERQGVYILTEEIILNFLPKIFKKYDVKSGSVVRVTRNADIDADRIDDEELDYREHMAEVIRRRRKLCPIRLEMTSPLSADVTSWLCNQLDLLPDQIFVSDVPADLSFNFVIQDKLRSNPNLFFPKRVPQNPVDFSKDKSVAEQIKERDRLISLPYESIEPFLTLLSDAAKDPNVVSIRMTLYRLAKNSKVVEALVEAAEKGKQVDVLVELKARFDEQNNIRWSRRLEEAGCHVIYGIDNLKVHSKLCLITRCGKDGVEYITQIGTGNYNEKTARQYTDLQLLTANEEIAHEAYEVFSTLSLGEVVEETQHLLVAPKCLQNKVIALIEEQINLSKKGEPAYIGLKLNSLTDKKIMEKLIEASCAGVKIDMIIRGICCLQSGIPGYTENIRIISIVGRFLEHSRIYIFGDGDNEKMYISSADFMTRNTLRRVEVAAPIYDKTIRNRLRRDFNTMLNDNCKARLQVADGKYQRVKNDSPENNAQEYFYQEAYNNAE